MTSLLIILYALIVSIGWAVLSVRQRNKLTHKARINKWRVSLVIAVMLLLGFSMVPIGKPPQDLGKALNTNLDVYLMVDNSLSMDAIDYDNGATRLEGIKADFVPKLDELAGSRFTLVTFHGKASVEFPGIYDTNAVKLALTTLEPPSTTLAMGTAFVPAMKLIVERSERAKLQENTKNLKKVLIILSDGERIGETEDAQGVLSTLRQNFGSVLVISVGTEKGATMKIKRTVYDDAGKKSIQEEFISDPVSHGSDENIPRDKNGMYLAVSKADPGRLKDFASKLNGRFIELHTKSEISSELKKLAAASTLLPRDQGILTQSAPNRFYWIFAFASFILLWIVQLRILPQLRMSHKKGAK